MSGLVVDLERCVGCRRCERVCANAGIEVVQRRARVLDGCIACGMCVDACPVGALAIERDEGPAQDLSQFHDIWVFCQVDAAGELAHVALELVAKGAALARERGCRLVAIVGEGAEATDDNARRLVAAGANTVIRGCDDRFVGNDCGVYAAWLTDLAQRLKPETILYGATDFGRELAPRVAVALKTGLTADCTVLEIDAETGLLQQTRPAFGGNLMATIVCPSHRPQMATVRPGIFPAPAEALGPVPKVEVDGRVADVLLDLAVCAETRVLERRHTGETASITDADALVVVGRGIGGKKSLPLMRRLCELLGERLGCTCELGCTRPVVEAGWLDYAHQVGQTGASVAPKLLVSVGVSGAIQHVAGIGGASCVVAINEDAGAPIFGAAHYKVVGDCIEVVSGLVEELQG